jgi:hypothetical protein
MICLLIKRTIRKKVFQLHSVLQSLPKSIRKLTFMKKCFLFILCAFLLIRLEAQNITENKSDNAHPFYLGVGTGFDNFTGMVGVSGTLYVVDNLAIRGGLGIGGWGAKKSIGLKLDSRNDGKWSYNLGYSVASGLDDASVELETNNGQTSKVKVDLLSASTLNLAIDRNWRIGRSNNFYLEFGYAIPMQGQRWKMVEGYYTTNNGAKVLDIMQPGGIILGAGFAFKL